MPGTEKTPPHSGSLDSARESTADGELVAGLHARDPRALNALYDRYASYAFAVALRILHDREEAEEAVQDAIWQIWTGRVRYDPLRGRFRTWLFMIARSRALDRLRRRTSARTAKAGAAEAESLTGVDPFALELTRDLRERLATLSPDQRDAIVLSFYLGLTHDEIAQSLGAPIGTVKSRIRRGLLELRSAFAAPGEES